MVCVRINIFMNLKKKLSGNFFGKFGRFLDMALLTGLMTFLNLLALPGSVILDDLEFIYSEC